MYKKEAINKELRLIHEMPIRDVDNEIELFHESPNLELGLPKLNLPKSTMILIGTKKDQKDLYEQILRRQQSW